MVRVCEMPVSIAWGSVLVFSGCSCMRCCRGRCCCLGMCRLVQRKELVALVVGLRLMQYETCMFAKGTEVRSGRCWPRGGRQRRYRQHGNRRSRSRRPSCTKRKVVRLIGRSVPKYGLDLLHLYLCLRVCGRVVRFGASRRSNWVRHRVVVLE